MRGWFAILVAAALCACSSSPSTTAIRYEVRLRDGGDVAAAVSYRLPSGQIRHESVHTPWSSPAFSFEEKSDLLIEARTPGSVDSPLLCVLASVEAAQGAYVLAQIGDPLSACRTVTTLETWPPDDQDPINNPLIRVG